MGADDLDQKYIKELEARVVELEQKLSRAIELSRQWAADSQHALEEVDRRWQAHLAALTETVKARCR